MATRLPIMETFFGLHLLVKALRNKTENSRFIILLCFWLFIAWLSGTTYSITEQIRASALLDKSYPNYSNICDAFQQYSYLLITIKYTIFNAGIISQNIGKKNYLQKKL
ncbi:hypothetical protein HDU92_005024 [Lobulomyces angularis]|nr:hypothetical protein HDU92_005024 [Lobulomyces angularis]